MTYEDEIKSLAFFLEEGHTFRVPRFCIHALRKKDKYLVSVKKVQHVFDTPKKAATFYRQETHSSNMIEAMEFAKKEVASWPEWKRNVLRNSDN